MTGRTPNAEEKRFMKKMGQLPCVACLLNGEHSPQISLHHIDGRVKPGAHLLILPLCVYHHQHAAPVAVRAKYPWLVPVHACGSVGGKRAFESLNNTQEFLLDLCKKLLEKFEDGMVIESQEINHTHYE